MYLLYIDESGVTNRHPSQTTHYVMLGMAVHVGTWFALTKRVRQLKLPYSLDGNTERLELHAAWMLRAYHEQSLIPDFERLSRRARNEAVTRWREDRKRAWPTLADRREVDKERKAFRRTEPYVHLTRQERDEIYSKALRLVRDHRRGIVLFGQAIDKRHLRVGLDPAEEAFAHLVRSFEGFLQSNRENPWGILLVDHDPNQNSRYTDMLRRFQEQDGARGGVDRIIEAPFFLDSRANSGVQVADLCAFALRRYLENQEQANFEHIFPKFHRVRGGLYGLRHHTAANCGCLICSEPRAAELPRTRWRRRPAPSRVDPAARPDSQPLD